MLSAGRIAWYRGRLHPIPPEELAAEALGKSNHPGALLRTVQCVQLLDPLQNQHPIDTRATPNR